MQCAHNDYDITTFHGALLDIIGVMNQPARDEQLLQAAGVQLEQLLFPLLVAIGRRGPIGVVELADNLGRDYTTVSRQVKKLDARARQKLMNQVLANWSPDEVQALFTLTRKYADSLQQQ